MIIDCISDLHGHYPELEGGDLLIVAGDLTALHTQEQYFESLLWLMSQDYKRVIYIAGNHDTYIQQINPNNNTWFFDYYGKKMEYLQDSATEFEGLKIWGSPWSKTFPGMNPKCKAFTVDTEEELAEKWALIPEDVEILITHSPAWTILDQTIDGNQVGSTALLAELLQRITPKIVVSGHIHEAFGRSDLLWNRTRFVNASYVNEHYEPVNKPIRVIL